MSVATPGVAGVEPAAYRPSVVRRIAVVVAAAVRPVRRAREKLQLPLPAALIGGRRRLPGELLNRD